MRATRLAPLATTLLLVTLGVTGLRRRHHRRARDERAAPPRPRRRARAPARARPHAERRHADPGGRAADHRDHVRGRHRHPQRRARRGRRWARRSTWSSRPTRPASCTCTRPPSRSWPTRPAPAPSRWSSTSPASSRSSPTTSSSWSSSSKSAEVGAGARPPGATCSPTGSAAPRTCRSRSSSRSPARSPRWSCPSPSWRSPGAPRATTRPPAAGPAPAWLDRLTSSTAWRVALRVLGFAFFLYVAAAAVFGQDTLVNPFLGVFYVLLWVGIVPLSLLLGPVWKAISPSRTINAVLARVSGSDPEVGMYAYPERLGYWPAAVGLFAFVWLELVYPHSTELGPVRLWCAVYIARHAHRRRALRQPLLRAGGPLRGLLVAGGQAVGVGPPRRAPGRSAARWPTSTPSRSRPGWSAWSRCCSAARRTTRSRSPARGCGSSRRRRSPRASSTTSRCSSSAWASGSIFAAGCMATGVARGTRRSTLPDLFAHSMVPIIVGYIIAHYLTYLVEYGQTTLVQLSDPFSRGDDYLGTADLAVNYWLSFHPDFLARLKVGAVVVGHVLGVIAAHDRAVRLLPRRHQLTGQLPLLAGDGVLHRGRALPAVRRLRRLRDGRPPAAAEAGRSPRRRSAVGRPRRLRRDRVSGGCAVATGDARDRTVGPAGGQVVDHGDRLARLPLGADLVEGVDAADVDRRGRSCPREACRCRRSRRSRTRRGHRRRTGRWCRCPARRRPSPRRGRRRRCRRPRRP